MGINLERYQNLSPHLSSIFEIKIIKELFKHEWWSSLQVKLKTEDINDSTKSSGAS